MLARKLACPSCDVRLRIADTLPVGKVIRCPKCGTGFRVPPVNGAANGASAPAPRAAAAAAVARKAVPPPEEEDAGPEAPPEESRPKKRTGTKKRKKKAKKAAGTSPLAWVVLGGGALLLAGAAVALVFALRSGEKKDTGVAENGPPVVIRSRPPGPSDRQEPESSEAPAAAQPETTDSQPAAEPQPTGDTSQASAGQQVFQAHNCARCHQVGSGGGGRARGPNLATVGRNPEHTVEWLMEHVRNPQSHRPESRMPAYDGKINETDLRALGEFLASLK